MRKALYTSLFLANFGLTFVYPIFTPLIIHSSSPLLPYDLTLALRMLLLALLLAIYPIAQLCAAPLFEHLSCGQSGKKWIILTTIGQGVGFALSGLGIFLHHYPLLVCSRLLTGACSGSLGIVLGKMTTIGKKQTQTVAVINGIAFIGAIFFGGELSQISPSLPFWVITAATLILAGYIATHFTSKEKCATPLSKHIMQYKRLLRAKGVYSLYFSLFFFMIGWITTLQFLSAYLLEHFTQSKELITTTFLISGIIWLLTYFILFPIFGKYRRLLTTSLLCVAVATIIAADVRSYLPFILALSAASLFASLAWTKLLITISSHAPPELRGIPLSLNQIVTLGAMIVAPIVGGALGTLDSRFIYIFAAISYSLAAGIRIAKNRFK